MTYIVFIFEALMIVPLAMLIRQSDSRMRFAWFGIGAMLFLYSGFGPLGLSLISWAYYAGHTKALEVTIIDVLACAMFLAQGKANNAKPPFRIVMALYFLSAAVSIAIASIKMPALFYCWQLLRMYLLYVVVFRGSFDRKNIDYLLLGMAAGLIVEFLLVVYGRLAGNFQPSGTFSHRNALGIVSNLVFIPLVSLVLAERGRSIFSLAILSGLGIAALTASRATFGLAMIGTVLSYLFSILNGFSTRKMIMGLSGAVVAAIALPVGFATLDLRQATLESYSDTSDYDEREAFKNAASWMLSDHPFGVGANNFVVAANTQGYYDRAGVAAVAGSRSAHVHNLYWLTLAELGYFGFIALCALLLLPLVRALHVAWVSRGKPESDLLAGLGLSLAVCYVHSYFEWITIVATTQYFLAVNFGLIAAISTKMKNPKLNAPGL
jgi:hypothetical protein